MAYEPQTWVDGGDGGTPITAERLSHIEDGITAAHKTAADLAKANRKLAAENADLTKRVTALEELLTA